MTTPDIDGFLNAFARWAEQQPDIRAVALVGSYARNAATATSDVDLVIVARDPETYLQDRDWADLFGSVEHHRIERYGKVTSLRVTYRAFPEVEYGFTDETWAAPPLDEVTRAVLSAGMRVLWDTGQRLSRLGAML